MHAWKNLSRTEIVRMAFVVQSCERVVVDGREFGEDFGGLIGGGKEEMFEDGDLLVMI